jgi:hypothetical protein
MRARVRSSVSDGSVVSQHGSVVSRQGDTGHRFEVTARRSPESLNAETLLSLQRAAGNRAVLGLLTPALTVQRSHHDRAAAVAQLETFKQGTWGYSLSGVYRNFNRLPTSMVGDGSGLGELVQKESEFLNNPVPKDPVKRSREAERWGKKESDTFNQSSDPQTKKVGAMLAPETRATMLMSWSSGGQWMPDWLKSPTKESQ